MKHTIITRCQDESEALAVISAVKNSVLLADIYSEVFRPIIKYSDDEKLSDAYRLVWEELEKYLSSH